MNMECSSIYLYFLKFLSPMFWCFQNISFKFCFWCYCKQTFSISFLGCFFKTFFPFLFFRLSILYCSIYKLIYILSYYLHLAVKPIQWFLNFRYCYYLVPDWFFFLKSFTGIFCTLYNSLFSSLWFYLVLFL